MFLVELLARNNPLEPLQFHIQSHNLCCGRARVHHFQSDPPLLQRIQIDVVASIAAVCVVTHIGTVSSRLDLKCASS